MANNMKAAFTLTLDDKLSSGLNAIKQGFDRLKQVGGQLNLGKLGQEGGDLLRTIGREARNLTSNLEGISAAADRSWAAMKRMASTRFGNVEKQLFGQNGFRGPGHEVAQRGQLGVIGGALAGYSIYKPATDYAGFENTLRHIAITEKLSGPAVETEVARLTKNLKAEALNTGQSSEELSKAYTFLITTGMTPELVDKLMPSHAKAATAYNISSESMGQAVFALNDSFKIPHQDMGAALSAMAYAAKEAHFTVENFSQFLPAIGGRMQLLGMTGRPAADTAFAALETVVKNSSMPSQAATNFQDLMQYMTAPIATRSFAKQGIDLPKMLINAEKQGVNPLDAFLGKLDSLTKGKSPVEQAEIVGKLIHNQEAASAALSILQHKDEYQRMRRMFGGIGADTLETDFQTAVRAPAINLRKGQEAGTQVERRAGEGFQPIVDKLSGGLQSIATGIDTLDQKFPGLTDATLAVTGSLLTLAAGLAAIGFVAPAVSAGFSLLGGMATLPFVGLAAVLGGAGAIQGAQNTPWVDEYGRVNGYPGDAPAATDLTAGDGGAKHQLDIRLTADPGTKAEVTRSSPDVNWSMPDPGLAMSLP